MFHGHLREFWSVLWILDWQLVPIENYKIGHTLRSGQRVIPQSVIGKNDGESAIRSPPAALTGAL
jgi:hypothetical protein